MLSSFHLPTEFLESMSRAVVEALRSKGVSLVASLPSTDVSLIVKMISQDHNFIHVQVSNEGLGVAVCTGAWLGGKKAAVVMTSAGLYMSTYQLTRACQFPGIPVLLLIGYNPDLGDRTDWTAKGRLTFEPLLNALQIPYIILRDPKDATGAVARAMDTANNLKYAAAVLIATGPK